MHIPNNGKSAFLSENWIDVAPRPIKAIANSEDEVTDSVRIGFSGAQGVGKNLLAKKLAKALDLPLIEQLPKAAKELGFKLNKSTNVDSQVAMWLAQLHEQLTFQNFVSDRTLVDHFAYMTYYAQHNTLGIDSYILRAIGNITAGTSYEQYSIIFYIPPTGPIVPNGVRSTDKRYQKDMDKLILNYLNSFEVDYIPLPGTMETKFDTAFRYIGESGLLNALIEGNDE